MRLTLEQFEEMYESMVFINAFSPSKQEINPDEYIRNYLLLLSYSGTDTLCESYDYSHINENFLSDFVNLIKGRKLIKAKYRAYDAAAKNYVNQSKNLDKIDDIDARSKKRLLLMKSYENSIKKIDSATEDKLSELVDDTPILSKYEKFAKIKYQLNLFKLKKKFDVSMAKIKGFNANVHDLKNELSGIVDAIKSTEEKIKAKKEKEKSNTKPKAKQKKTK